VDAYDSVTYKPNWNKYPDNYYREIEDDIGILMARAEYNNTPHVQGEIFTDEQIVWDKLPRLSSFNAIVFHWDIAYTANPKSDYNAIRGWGYHQDLYWYIEGFVKQCIMKDAVR
jgi:phage terminase large subunit-like protein